jgi:hypothetical protein
MIRLLFHENLIRSRSCSSGPQFHSQSGLCFKKYQEEEEELTTKYHESHLFPPWRDATARIHYLVYARLPTVQTILKVMLHF